MFDIGWSELLVIAVVAIVVVGPKELPRMMRTFGSYASKLRRMAGDFQRQFDDAMREAEIEEVKKAMHSVRDDLNAPIDKPLMLPTPSKEASTGAASAASPPTSKPAPKPKRKKPNKPVAGGAGRAETAKSKASRGNKP